MTLLTKAAVYQDTILAISGAVLGNVRTLDGAPDPNDTFIVVGAKLASNVVGASETDTFEYPS